ncbi:MAG TPA: hypothetical protein VGN69_07685, partial [Solirubrobacteraceae bacterium]|nr:hypothetical protein [Solirubrobacteraceae bacterium]
MTLPAETSALAGASLNSVSVTLNARGRAEAPGALLAPDGVEAAGALALWELLEPQPAPRPSVPASASAAIAARRGERVRPNARRSCPSCWSEA